MQAKRIIGVVLVFLVLVGLVIFWLTTPSPETAVTPITEPVIQVEPTSTSTQSVIGYSVEKRPIEVYTFGTGETNLLFVGGIHGGYEWNSILVAYEMIDAFIGETITVPENITVHIIPNLNPDGLYAATNLEGRFAMTDIPNNDMHTSGIGRFNANNIDLNRNFDCRWAESATWRGNTVSAGVAPFSEPEAVALRDYVDTIDPAAAVFWHSQAGNVYGSECGGEVTPQTLALMQAYAISGSYGQVPIFDAYTVTGAAEDWLASLGVPTVSVELGTRTSSEREKNLAGTEAVLELYAK